jgi:DDE superfamily endonuclease
MVRELAAAHLTHSDAEVFFRDEARIGQKGRVCHRWFTRGERPPGLADRRFTFAYIFAAVEAGTDDAFALTMPWADTPAMQAFLDRFSQTVPADEHIAMFADQAGWHIAHDLHVPPNITLVELPSYAPSSTPSSGYGSTSRSASSRTSQTHWRAPSSTSCTSSRRPDISIALVRTPRLDGARRWLSRVPVQVRLLHLHRTENGTDCPFAAAQRFRPLSWTRRRGRGCAQGELKPSRLIGTTPSGQWLRRRP